MKDKTKIWPIRLKTSSFSPTGSINWRIVSLICAISGFISCKNPTYTANDVVPAFHGNFDFGCNMGYFPPLEDEDLALLAQKCGVNSLRPGLFHHFLSDYGFEYRIPTFQYYSNIGLRNIVAILGYPAPAAQDTQSYCTGHQSALFRGMYEPIWIPGSPTKTVNPSNIFAQYVWEIATRYKGLIRIYEIWNEPDFNHTQGWRPRGMAENWWENAPLPCETPLHAPPYHYIRLLRIAYEVIKNTDADALVAVGGLGWPSYLDVICRYTDEPTSGRVESQHFPLRGGAYFDCMNFHSYPHLSGAIQAVQQDTLEMEYYSEQALNEFWRLQNQFDTVLKRYGYNDTIYPAKHWICTEFNLPRHPSGAYFGSQQAQINFVIKAMVTAQMRGIKQMHLYALADDTSTSDRSFHTMGLYAQNNETPIAHPLAWAYKTTAMLLEKTQFHPEETRKMALKCPIQGGAFQHADGRFTYVLWADTAGVQYFFPPDLQPGKGRLMHWDFSLTNTHNTLNNKALRLNSNPVFWRR